MQQKKIAAAVCTLGMLALSLTACGSSNKNDDASMNGTNGTQSASDTDTNSGGAAVPNGADTDGDGFIENAADDIGNAVGDIGDTVGDVVSDGADVVKDAVTGVGDAAEDIVGGSEDRNSGDTTDVS